MQPILVAEVHLRNGARLVVECLPADGPDKLKTFVVAHVARNGFRKSVTVCSTWDSSLKAFAAKLDLFRNQLVDSYNVNA
jgi:hypothetical protein